MKKYVLFFFALLCSALSAFSQYDLTMYNMQNIPQSMYGNPALTPFSKVNIGLPVLSSIYLRVSNSGFVYSDVIHPAPQDTIDIENLIDQLKASNYLAVSFNTDLLSFGFRVKKNYFSFNATEKVQAKFTYPKDLIALAWRGNGYFIGREASFKDIGLDLSHYREYGVSMSRDFLDDNALTVGARIKYLYGMENVNTARSNISISTDSTNYEITAKSDFLVNTSIDTSFDSFSVTNYVFKKNNTGFGLDLGANWKINDKFSVSGSVTDIGYIKWKQDVTNFFTNDASFTFKGIDYNALSDSSSSDSSGGGFSALGDSVKAAFNVQQTHNAYTTWLAPQIFLAGNYHINDKNFAGVLLHAEYFHSALHPSFTISYNNKVGRWLSASASYSILNGSYNNFGLGLSLNGGPLQFYIVDDNVLGSIIVQNSRNAHIRFGLNLTFGRPAKDRDKDGVADKKDDCPDVPGLAEFNGCPDRDGDKVMDRIDQCPDIAGLKEMNGCPDHDGDKVQDAEDECPDVAGMIDFHGCPDLDNDMIPDKLDSCPDVVGPKETNGCPDSDKDGIIDKNDKCPYIYGVIKFDGCPDTDGDDIPDWKDKCPDVFGPPETEGCPDHDQDGILDKDDACPDVPGLLIYKGCADRDLDDVPDPEDDCPDTYGDKANKGCPLVKVDEKFQLAQLTQQEQEVLKEAFSNLEFQTGKAVIEGSSKASLDELANVLTKKPDFKLYISGHTDNVGAAAANKKLSENRAKAVKDYLLSKGIAATRITAEGFGSTHPVADNKTTEGKQMNRRVELKITK